MYVPEPPPPAPTQPFHPAQPFYPVPPYGPVPPANLRRSPWRKPLIVLAVILTVLLNVWGAVIWTLRDEEGVHACRNIAELVQEGEYASMSHLELYAITERMADSYNEELAALGHAYQRQIWRQSDEGYPLEGTPAVDTLIEVTREPCRQVSADDKPWPF